MQMLQKMLKKDLLLQIMIQEDNCLEEKNKKVNGLMRIMTDFAALNPKTYSYLTVDNNEN